MKIKPVLMFSLAIGIALFVAFLSYGQLQKKAKAQTRPSNTLPVAVAVLDLPWGTPLTKSMIKFVPFLKESLPAGYFSDPSAIEGRVLVYPIKANEPIFESKLAPATIKTGGVAAVVSPQKRAMSVKVDKVIGISGFIHPGNRVDVLVTMGQRGKVSTPITKIVLENILVLAAGPQMEKDNKKEKSAQVEVITLEVTPEEAEKLTLAVTEGHIQLALRNFIDSEDVITRGTTIPMLLTSYMGKKKAGRAPSKPQVLSVQLIKGSCVTELNFGKEGE